MKATFNIWYPTEWGEQLFVLGSCPELGSWDITKALPLSYFPGAEWKAEATFPKSESKTFEYKYIVKNDQNALLWEEPNIRRFQHEACQDLELIEFRDTWRKPGDPETVFFTSAFLEVIFKHGQEPASPKKKSSSVSAKTTIRLQILAPRVEPGHHIYAVGSLKSLGLWNVSHAKEAICDESGLWGLDLHVGREELPFSYMYIIKDKKGKVVVEEAGHHRNIISLESLTNTHYRPAKHHQKKLIVVTDELFRYPKEWKGAGIAIPVFSLRSKESLGTGEFLDLKLLIDWAALCGLKLIQILPVNDTSVSLTWRDSYPYSSISVFALHPIYLNLQAIATLPKDITAEIEKEKVILNGYDHVNYEEVMAVKLRLVRQIFKLQKTDFLSSQEFQLFFKENSQWLAPYAAFCFLRDKFGTSDFSKWDKYAKITEEGIRAITSAQGTDYDSIALHYFIQFHLHKQMEEASDYAKGNRVVLKGDIPIGINKHSDSCWKSPQIFHLDQCAGAPPDPFSDVGQNWELPTYNWRAMQEDNYGWWKTRLAQMASYFQMIRLDHVLGFFRIWEIPEYNISGLMGHFNPAIPLWRDELEREGIWDFNRLCEPYIPLWLVRMIFGPRAQYVIATFLEEKSFGSYRLKPEFSTQKQIEASLALPENAAQELKEKNEMLKAGLFGLITNVILFLDARMDGFHPRINMMDTCSFATLDGWEKEKLVHFYHDYFYHRQEKFWAEQAMIKLPVLKSATKMLICGEDLGMVPDCVPRVMEELCILGLRIQRMPKESAQEFGIPADYPYLTVCTTSSHDMSTIRGWWGEDYARTQRYYKNILGHTGDAPSACGPEIVREIIAQHLESPSMWAVFPLQDILALSKELCRPGDPREEQINDPADPHHYWKFRLHINLEKLIDQKDFNANLRKMVSESGRDNPY